ncbi:uncharacterized protein LOC127851469 [Dreissena polymorpha]|uniref:Uncharacterized protein n=1 Tax=Dreissena polymorpha TaxID=45954 RepID=A0A9D4DC91_DREPO|nr:uncharacterized protein LOC127851469 [Dreissena polymorpha]XP_052241242.1 uncharacterized protein LOC127851469 [Dreissena polymorpha]KAH3742340.1 hypothetical protein DPMN_049081 [Dreissena polymorpha]
MEVHDNYLTKTYQPGTVRSALTVVWAFLKWAGDRKHAPATTVEEADCTIHGCLSATRVALPSAAAPEQQSQREETMYDETDGHDFTHHSDDDTNVPMPSVAALEPDPETDTQALDLETSLTDSLGEIKDAQGALDDAQYFQRQESECKSSSSSSVPIRVVSRKRLRQVSSSDEEDPYTTTTTSRISTGSSRHRVSEDETREILNVFADEIAKYVDMGKTVSILDVREKRTPKIAALS